MEKTDNIKEIVKEVGVLIEKKENIGRLLQSVCSMNGHEYSIRGLVVLEGMEDRGSFPFEKIEKVIGKDKMKMAVIKLTDYLIEELVCELNQIKEHISRYKIEKK